MKKAVFIVILMVLVLWACSDKDKTSEKSDTAKDQITQARSEEEIDKELHDDKEDDREQPESPAMTPKEQPESSVISPKEQPDADMAAGGTLKDKQNLQEQPVAGEDPKLIGGTTDSSSEKKGTVAYLEEDAAKKAAAAEQAREKLISAKRDAYYERLKNLENQYDAKKLYSSGGSTSEVSSKLWSYYEIWDKELNDIYAQLTSSLSGEALEKMKQQERDWIVERDRKVNEACNENSGGKTVMIIQPDRLIQETKSRIYELAEIYYAK